jgi:phosphatidylserine/phosphatidylglycerophosphate/cardiolipin synthase-like enzyme
MDGLMERFDRASGLAIDAAVSAHHRRRLRRVDHGNQLEPPEDGRLWAAGDPPPRSGCKLEPLIDGAEALPRIAEALAGARSHVHIAGWHLMPDFGLERGEQARRLRDQLAELAERVSVRVLLWAGAPLPVFSPRRSQMRRVREELTRGTQISCALDGHERPMHCHHEKLVIVDDHVAFVGGIDLTSLAGDRFDSSGHPARGSIGWHDASTRLEGSAVADVADHFLARWEEVTGERLPAATPPAPAGDQEVQVIRTVPEKIYGFLPRGDFRILEGYLRALRSAESFVYLENQFLWAPQIVETLLGKLREPPSTRFRLVVLLPAKPNNGADDTRGQLAQLAEADAGAGRFLAVTLSSRSGGLSGPLYVHAKVGIVDDRWLTIGSANLNEHSLFNDTEVNVVSCDRALARDTRLRLWAEHLERPVSEVDGEVADAVDTLWRPIAREQLERRERGLAATITCSSCVASRAARPPCWVRCRGSWSTGEEVGSMGLMARSGRELRAILRAETPTHRRFRDHLTVIVIATIGVDLLCTVLAYLLERDAAGTEIHTLGSAFFWVSTQLLTVSSSIKDPISFGGRALDIFMEAYAITVIAALAGSTGAFIQKRGLEHESGTSR